MLLAKLAMGFAICSLPFIMGCEALDAVVDEATDGSSDTGVTGTGPDTGPVGEDGVPADALPVSLSEVTWLHTDVSGWAKTSTLQPVQIGGGDVVLVHSKARDWPDIALLDTRLNANPWVFVEIDGRWYAGTFEWMRSSTTTRGMNTVAGDHIKVAPLGGSWRPRSGQRLGFMISGLARTGARNVQERTNIVMATWP